MARANRSASGDRVETLSGDIALDLPEFDAPPDDPLPLLVEWLDRARDEGVREPQALALATVGADGRPSSRIVLLKQVLPSILFTTHYGSRKGGDLKANPWAAGTLYWRETTQQVSIEGSIEPIGAREADELFADRPRRAQAVTVVSRQSAELADEAELRELADALSASNEPIERPADWGGYRLQPDRIEFWHGNADRLHRRLLYSKGASGWTYSRLQP